jgi:UDPglucose 6-dehydrogenase
LAPSGGATAVKPADVISGGRKVKRRTVAVVGYGAVGQALAQLWPGVVIYDKPQGLGTQEEVNRCDYAFVAVPTSQAADGTCDTAIVEEVVSWLDAGIIILRSTVSVGTTERLSRLTGKRIIFQPEFGPGETPDHPFQDLRSVRWVILGGDRGSTIEVADLYKTAFNADCIIHQTTARTAELVKYMENCFLALKVTFCNEFYDIAGSLDVDYNELREYWLLDPRIGRSHTFVMPDNRGFGGKCLPKDVSAMAATARAAGSPARLLEAAIEINAAFRAPSTVDERPSPHGLGPAATDGQRR